MKIENNNSWVEDKMVLKKNLKVLFKYLLQIFLVLLILFLWVLYDIGMFRNGKTELYDNFMANEKEFTILETYANSVLPTYKVCTIRLWIVKKAVYEFYVPDKYSLIIYPRVDSGKTFKEIGGFYLEVGSPTLDSATHYLGWTNETLKQLQSKLSEVNCDYLQIEEDGIVLENEHGNTLDPHHYVIYKDLSRVQIDSSFKSKKPISESPIGKRTKII